jgi:uncharacterized protein YjbI with pentapeptide repeats
MNIFRRGLLLSSITFVGCDVVEKFVHKVSKKITPLSALSNDERSWLSDEASRRQDHGDNPIIFKGRIFSIDEHLRDKNLSNIIFIDCTFIHHMMFDVDLSNINFINCDFSQVRWDRGHWDNVLFKKCYMEGKDVQLYIGSGSNSTFEECQFQGTTPPTPQEINMPRWYGLISAPGHAKFSNCKFDRMEIIIDASSSFEECHFSRIIFRNNGGNVTHEFSMKNCVSKKNFILGKNSINEVKLIDSRIEYLVMGGIKSKKIKLENLECGMGIEEAILDEFKAIKTKFLTPAEKDQETAIWFAGTQATIVEFSQCSFASILSSIDCEPEPLDPNVVGEQPLPQPTRVDVFRFKDMFLPNGNFNQSIIGSIEFEKSTLGNISFKKAKLDKLTFNEVLLSGTIDFSEGGSAREVSQNSVRHGPNYKLFKSKPEDITF